MSGPAFKLLRWFIHNKSSELVIPKIVLEEVKNKYIERANENYRSTAESVYKLGSHLGQDLKIPISKDGLIEKCDQFAIQLEQALKLLNANIIPYKDIPHSDLIKRDLERKRPFRKVGKKNDSAGYRDALIWESILKHVLPRSNTVAFISNNKTDFYGESSNHLHAHLQKDLLERGFNPDNLLVYMDIQAFVDAHVKPLLPKADESEESPLALYLLNDKKKIENLLMQYFIKNKGEVSRQLERKIGLPFEFGWSETDMLTIREIGEIQNFSVLDAREIIDDFLYVEFEFESNFEIEFYAHSYFPDVDDYLPNCITVEEWENDKYGAWLVAYIDLPMSGSLTLNVIDGAVDSIEGSFPEIYGFCKKCEAPIISDAAESCYNCGYDFF